VPGLPAVPALRVPDSVRTALAVAQTAGFPYSCADPVGRLLATLALSLRPQARIAESGTGYGVGSNWLRSGMRPGSQLYTVERDPIRGAHVADLFAADPQVHVLLGEWTLLAPFAPFDLFFCDGGGKREDPDGVIDLLAPGGILVLDDFTAGFDWPPFFDGAPDDLLIHYLTHPLLQTTRIQTDAEMAVVIATRR
jgi:predicted O-methyltransferase YrrM